MASSETTWKPGQSGNPHGRPPKERALTAQLERSLNKPIEFNGQRIAGKRVIASLLVEIVTTGKATMPDGSTLTVSPDLWFDAIRFVYGQVDGPPQTKVDLTSGGEPLRVVLDV